tara:strand:- start:1176 stop:1586 length:411 start_codon:yes stop_codon:yes gene_type:complete
MEIKKSAVTNVQPNGTWDGKYGLMYKFDISFENGDTGSYLSKYENQTKFIVGQETEYEYTGGEYPRVKPHYVNPVPKTTSYSNSNTDKDLEIRFAVAFKAAIELCSNDKIEMEEVMATTIGFAEFLKEKKNTSLPF